MAFALSLLMAAVLSAAPRAAAPRAGRPAAPALRLSPAALPAAALPKDAAAAWPALEAALMQAAEIDGDSPSRLDAWKEAAAKSLRDDPGQPLETVLARAFAQAHALDEGKRRTVEAVLAEEPLRSHERGKAKRLFKDGEDVYVVSEGFDLRWLEKVEANGAARHLYVTESPIHRVASIEGRLHVGSGEGFFWKGEDSMHRLSGRDARGGTMILRDVTGFTRFAGRHYVGTDVGVFFKEGEHWHLAGKPDRINALSVQGERLVAFTDSSVIAAEAPKRRGVLSRLRGLLGSIDRRIESRTEPPTVVHSWKSFPQAASPEVRIIPHEPGVQDSLDDGALRLQAADAGYKRIVPWYKRLADSLLVSLDPSDPGRDFWMNLERHLLAAAGVHDAVSRFHEWRAAAAKALADDPARGLMETLSKTLAGVHALPAEAAARALRVLERRLVKAGDEPGPERFFLVEGERYMAHDGLRRLEAGGRWLEVPGAPKDIRRLRRLNGKLHAATNDGVFVEDGSAWKRIWKDLADDVSFIDGRLFIGGFFGAVSRGHGETDWRVEELPVPKVHALHVQDGRLHASTGRGFWTRGSDGTWELMTMDEEIYDSVHQWGRWHHATADNGLRRFIQTPGGIVAKALDSRQHAWQLRRLTREGWLTVLSDDEEAGLKDYVDLDGVAGMAATAHGSQLLLSFGDGVERALRRGLATASAERASGPDDAPLEDQDGRSLFAP